MERVSLQETSLDTIGIKFMQLHRQIKMRRTLHLVYFRQVETKAMQIHRMLLEHLRDSRLKLLRQPIHNKQSIHALKENA
jgi:hypothetical protein